jgi:hypothetical protein
VSESFSRSWFIVPLLSHPQRRTPQKPIRLLLMGFGVFPQLRQSLQRRSFCYCVGEPVRRTSAFRGGEAYTQAYSFANTDRSVNSVFFGFGKETGGGVPEDVNYTISYSSLRVSR